MRTGFWAKIIPPSRRQDGVALIELMIAIFVIIISVLALYEMIVQGSGMLKEQQHRRLALEKAQGHMERLKFAAGDDTVPRGLAGEYAEDLVPEDQDNDIEAIKAEYIIHISHSDAHYEDGRPYYSDVSLEYNWVEPWTGRSDQIVLKSRF